MAHAEATKDTPLTPREAKEQKLAELLKRGIEPYPHVFECAHRAAALQETYRDLADGSETQDEVTVAGRIMAMRNDGMFIDLQDATGKIQVFSHKDSMSEAELSILALLDLGDVIGVRGTVRRTPRGELSVRAKNVTMLTKSLEPLPEKYHGLTDVEQRYRQRYVDLIVNEDTKKVLLMRSKIIRFLRDYLNDSGAVEVETPMLQPIMGGASAKPFITHHNALGADFYMKVAAELYIKRLLVGGLADHVFEIGRYFRNEGISIKHNPEFTGAEGNMLYADYHDMIDLIEGMVSGAVEHVHGTLKIAFGDKEIDFSRPWKRASMVDLVKEYTGVDFLSFATAREALDAATSMGIAVDPKANWGQIVEAVFAEKVEENLVNPTHVMDHPLDISPLSKIHRNNPRLVERFETYVNGWEIANCFTELNDPKIQHLRFEEQVAAREAGDDEAQMLDEDYINALRVGLPPNAGWGLGIDRLVMLLTDSHNIRDVICFPTLKPLKEKKAENKPAKAAPPTAHAGAPQTSDHTAVDENARRFVVILNGKEENVGRLMNALGHGMAGLVGQAAQGENFQFVDYVDGDGHVHPSISHYPVIVLKAKNSAQIRKVREGALEKGLPFTDFTESMTVGSTQAQLDATRAQSQDDLNYLGLCLFGDRVVLQELTGKLSLYK